MNEILKNIIVECSLIAQNTNLSKIVWDMPYITQGCYVRGFNQQNKETDSKEFNVTHIEHNIVDSFFTYANEIEPKINKGKLTIYPSGEYLSEFIWDNEAHLQWLFNNIYTRKQKFVENIFTVFEEMENEFSYISVIIDIKKNKEIHLERKVKTANGEIKEMALDLEKRHIEAILDFQLQTNEAELGEKAIKWNRAIFNIPADIYSFDPDKDVSFEWLPENEV